MRLKDVNRAAARYWPRREGYGGGGLKIVLESWILGFLNPTGIQGMYVVCTHYTTMCAHRCGTTRCIDRMVHMCMNIL